MALAGVLGSERTVSVGEQSLGNDYTVPTVVAWV